MRSRMRVVFPVLDVFADLAVLSLYEPFTQQDERALCDAVASVVSPAALYLKRRPKEARVDAQLKVEVQSNQVHFAFDVSNTGGKYVELSFPSGKSYDFVVVDSLGREVWQWSDGRMFTQGVRNKALGTGDSMKVDETWRGLPQPGMYTAIATLNSTNYPVQQKVDFVVR